MMKLKVFILAVLLLIAYMPAVLPVRSDATSYFKVVKVYWGFDQPTEVSPGDVATLAVILQMTTYESVSTVQGVKAELSLPHGFQAVGGGDKGVTFFSGTIALGSIIKLDFPLHIGREVSKGEYAMDVKLTYYVGQNLYHEETLDIAVEVTGRPDIDIEAQNGSLREGSQQIHVTLSNEGDAIARNLRVMNVYSSSASVELEGDKSLGDLQPGDNALVPLRLFVPIDTGGRIVSLNLDVNYLGPRDVTYSFSETLQLPVKPFNPETPLVLSLEPKELAIGKSSKVYIDLWNTGDHNLSEIRLVLSPDDILKIFGPTSLYVDRLKPGDHYRIETEMYVPSTGMTTTASLAATVTYLDDDLWMTQSESDLLTLLLRGLIEISVTDVAVIPSSPRPGGPFSVTITMTNVGTATAQAAYAVPNLENLPIKTFGPKSVYIGNIELNLPTTVTINLQLGNTTESELTLPVTLGYMDNLRSLHNFTFSVPINVAPQTSPPPQPSGAGGYLSLANLVIGGIAIVAVVAATVIVVKRRRRSE